MSKGRGVSGYTHTQQQLDDYANQHNPIIMHIGTIWTITQISVIQIMTSIGTAEKTTKTMIKEL